MRGTLTISMLALLVLAPSACERAREARRERLLRFAAKQSRAKLDECGCRQRPAQFERSPGLAKILGLGEFLTGPTDASQAGKRAPKLGPRPLLDRSTARVAERQRELSRRLLAGLPPRNTMVSGYLAYGLLAAAQAGLPDGAPYGVALGFADAGRTARALARLRDRLLHDATLARSVELRLELGAFTAGTTVGPADPTYRRLLRPLGTTIEHLPQTKESMSRLDRWIAVATGGRIRRAFSALFQKMPEITLLSAGMVDAPWAQPFNRAQTQLGHFFTSRCQATVVQMMRKTLSLKTRVTPRAVVLELPLRGDFSMRLVVPREVDGLRRHRRRLTRLLHQGLDSHASRRLVELQLPRLKIDSVESLTSLLWRVVPVARRRMAYLRFQASANWRIDRLEQVGSLQIDERGARAALAMIGTIGYSGGPPRVLRVRADHPFLLLIRHRQSGAPLFAAQIWTLGARPRKVTAHACYQPPREVVQGARGRVPSTRVRFRLISGPRRLAEVDRRIVRRHFNELRYCAQVELQLRPLRRGEVRRCRVPMWVDERGRGAAGSKPVVGGACACMKRAVGRWFFPTREHGTRRVLEVRTRLSGR